MFKLVRADLKYIFNSRTSLFLQGIMFLFITFFSVSAALSVSPETVSNGVNMDLSFFLFILTYAVVVIPIVGVKKDTPVDVSKIFLSLPIKKDDFVISKYVELLLYTFIIWLWIMLVSFITTAISGNSLAQDYHVMLTFQIIFGTAVVGMLYLMAYFITKHFKIICFIFYFATIFGWRYIREILYHIILNYMDPLYLALLLFCLVGIGYIISSAVYKYRDI